MAESSELYGVFLLGVRVAWDVCGCSPRVERIIQLHSRLQALASGELTLEDPPGGSDEELQRFAEWLEQQDQPPLVSGRPRDTREDLEELHQPSPEWDQELAKRVLASL